MKKLLLYFMLSFLFFNIEGNSDEILPIKENFEEIFFQLLGVVRIALHKH